VVAPESIDDAAIERLANVDAAAIAAARAAIRAGGEDASRDRLAHLLKIVAAARTYHGVALDLLAAGQTDLFSIYYQRIDEGSHRFAPCAAPAPPLCAPAAGAR